MSGPGDGAVGDSDFRIVERTRLADGYAFTLDSVTVEAPDGDHFQREALIHRGAVGVVALHDDRTITLVRQYRPALEREIIELPAGIRDVDGEATELTAARELEEETGLRAGSIEFLAAIQSAPGLMDERVWIYLATDLTEVGHDRQGHEEDHMTMHRLPLDELVAMVERGEITDAKTVVGILLTARR